MRRKDICRLHSDSYYFYTMRCIALLILLLSVISGRSQENNLNFGVNGLTGKMFKHTDKIHIPTPVYQQALEWSYRKQTQGNKAWQQRLGYPETSLNLLIAYNGSADLGYTFGIYPAIQFRLAGNKRFALWTKLGGGVGYVTKFWKRTPAADSVNNIIGGRINNVSMFQLGLRYHMSSLWSVQGGLHFYHASNASARQPNFGINTYGLFAGLTYHPKGYKHPFHKIKEENEKRVYSAGLRLGFSRAEDKIADGPMYSAYNISGFVQRCFRQKYQWSLGVDATYFEKLYAIYKGNGLYKGKENMQAMRYSVFLGNEFLFGKIGLPLQLGIYLNRPIQGPFIYQKLGLNYHVYQKSVSKIQDIFLFTQLKTHLVQAELAEIGIGFLF